MALDLPNDILLLVGDYLEDHQDRWNLIFVSRRFHGLFLRLVYRAATLKSCSQARSFLDTLLRRPELARAVRSLHFEDWTQNPLPPSSETDLTRFNDWARQISHSDEEYTQWQQDLLHEVEEAWIALFLPLASNLRQLHLVYPKENAYLDRALQRAMKGEKPFDTQSAFHALQEVSLSHQDHDDDTKGSYLPSQVLPFFSLPSMRAFAADSVIESRPPPEDEQNDEQEEPMLDAPVARSSRISEITLNSSNGSHGMGSLIASCASLKSFKYQHSDSHLLAEGYQPSEFHRTLAGSKTTLQTLWLDTCGNHLPFTIAGVNETHDEWFGSLADFTALTDIRIRLPNLLDVRYTAEPSTALPEVLPKSVKSLYVEGCKENTLPMLMAQLQLVLNRRSKQFANLERLEIEGFFHDEEDEDASGYQETAATNGGEKFIKSRVYETADPLRTACVDAGVELFLRDRECPATM